MFEIALSTIRAKRKGISFFSSRKRASDIERHIVDQRTLRWLEVTWKMLHRATPTLKKHLSSGEKVKHLIAGLPAIKGELIEGTPEQILYQRLTEDIADSDVRNWLDEIRKGDPNARERIGKRFKDKIAEYAEKYLYPTVGNTMLISEIQVLWNDLIELIGNTAERMWRDAFVSFSSEKDARDYYADDSDGAKSGRLKLLTDQSHLLMLLWVEARLYKLRALSNFRRQEGLRETTEKQFTIEADIRAILEKYRSYLQQWDDEIARIIPRQHFFREPIGDIERLRTFSREFGTEAEDEIGWAAHAQDARTELRYHYFDAQLSERWHSKRFFAAFYLFIQKVTTGFGTRPRNFVWTSVSVIAIISVLFWVNDFFANGFTPVQHTCYQQQTAGMNPLQFVFHYLYLAVTNLTSLGSNDRIANFCAGAPTQFLLIATSILGYFLLAVLASLLIEQLKEAE